MMAEVKIPGVDAEAVLDLCSGDMELFQFALQSFVSHVPRSLEKLQTVIKEELPDYAICVHSLKSACAAIGAQDVSEKAGFLEMAAKAGDFKTVLKDNGALLKDAQSLVNNVSNWIKASG